MYKNAKTKVNVTCKIHGDFPTYPDNHWNGTGCPDCSEMGFSCNRPAIFYVFQCKNITKVGITNSQVMKRNKAISKSYGEKFDIVTYYDHLDGLLVSQTETEIIQELRKLYKQPTEKFGGYSECFFDVDVPILLRSIEQKLGIVNEHRKEEGLGAGIGEATPCPT